MDTTAHVARLEHGLAVGPPHIREPAELLIAGRRLAPARLVAGGEGSDRSQRTLAVGQLPGQQSPEGEAFEVVANGARGGGRVSRRGGHAVETGQGGAVAG